MIRLSELEEKIMDTLWKLDRAFPKVLMAEMKPPLPAYNTVLSTIRKLEQKGHVGFKKYGKSHEYYPILKKDDYGKSLFKKVFDDVLKKSPVALASYFAEDKDIDIQQLQEALEKLNKSDDPIK